MSSVCLQVCVLCGEGASSDAVPAGRQLYEALEAAAVEFPEIEVAAVDCLAVCDRPVTLAFRAVGKWSYLIGGADPARDLADIIAAARAVAASEHGIPAMAERPRFFREGVIGRLPPAPREQGAEEGQASGR